MPEKTSRRTFLAAAGTGTIAALAGCGGGGDGDGDGNGTTTHGHTGTHTTESDTDTQTTTEGDDELIYSTVEYAQTADQAWNQKYLPNQGDSAEAVQARNEAYLTIEEMNWASVQELPTVHPVDQRFWSTDIDIPMYGVMENQTYDDVTKGGGPGGTLQMASPGPVQTLDPANAKGSGSGYNQYNQTLFAFPDGEYPPVGALATNYEVSDDGLTYTIELREDAVFHDGSQVTAQDVVYSWERLAGSDNSRNKDDIIGETMTIEHEKDVPEGEEATLGDYVNGSLAVEAVDDYTFEFTLRRQFPYTLFQIAGGAFAVIPEGAVIEESVSREGIDTEGEYTYDEFFSSATYIGAGPFQVDSWNKGSDIQLSAFSDYYGGEPELDGITYTVLSSANARYERFTNGNLDILQDMPTAQFNPDNVTITNDRGVIEEGTYTDSGQEYNYGRIPTLSTEYIVFNCTRVPRVVRRAFALMLDQDRVLRDEYKGVGVAGYHITPPAVFPSLEDGVTTDEAYDRHAESGEMSQTEFGADGYPWGYGEARIQEARQIMEEAGFGPDNQFTITATNISGNQAYGGIFTTLQEKARQAHIQMDITEADFGVIISQAIEGSMDMFALGDGMEYPSASNFLRFLHAGNPGTAFTRWGQNYAEQQTTDDSE